MVAEFLGHIPLRETTLPQNGQVGESASPRLDATSVLRKTKITQMNLQSGSSLREKVIYVS
jgi:hypothetical protein